MSRLNAKLMFVLSAACFVIPEAGIMMYEIFVPQNYDPITFVANDTMQSLLNTSDFLGDVGILFFLIGIVMWYREWKRN